VYAVNLAKVHVIPHGVTEWATEPSRSADRNTDRGANSGDGTGAKKRILTWGLISPGKGIEWGIRAVAELRAQGVDVEYVVAGQTHPKVLARDGESYRELLAALIDELGVAGAVTLDDTYRDLDELGRLVRTADVVLLPYDSREQVTSGVLSEAVAAGLPVVATGFPHAIELLGRGAGIIALHENPRSMAEALRTILTTRELAETMHNAALQNAGETSWSSVAARYRAVAETLVASQAA
jgi:glycosyltransferase involved in cell wall biosynthesis